MGNENVKITLFSSRFWYTSPLDSVNVQSGNLETTMFTDNAEHKDKEGQQFGYLLGLALEVEFLLFTSPQV